ncbi:MAG: PAS domain-containing protein [Deltaproteobacteria bacterium]|nr:PAS domain-containing protein [Deltaproteobacteria bacterium]
MAAVSFPVVGVGASAGGMEAFTELLRNVPTGTGMAFVLIQHLDPTHPSYLREALARTTGFAISEVEDGMRIEPDHVYVIPSHADVGITDGMLSLVPRHPAEARQPHLPIDFFFQHLAAAREYQAIGVVLSGTGSDGTEGLRAIKAEGGVTFAQEPSSAKFGGMPEAAIRAGSTDFVLPLPELAAELVRIGKHPFMAMPSAQAVLADPAEAGDLENVLAFLESASGVDFGEYKLTSVRRRLARRMAMHRLTSVRDYVQVLRGDRGEVSALFEDLLIHVTSFFRDADAFEVLADQVFPKLLQQKRHGTFRIWSAGCSTGEEAYSLVIALREFLARENASHVRIQLFATDVSEAAISTARAGVYSDAAVRELGADRIARWFTRLDGGGYQVNKSIREQCAFVKHDLSSDPPFSKLDLVSCRNVLIYFGPQLQERVIAMFHFALNSPGFLLLGRAENIPDGRGLFSAVDKESKVFARMSGRSVLRLTPSRGIVPSSPSPPDVNLRVHSVDNLLRESENELLERYVPPGVIVDERMEIVRFRGRTGAYLEVASGKPQYDLLRMARPGLIADLRIGIAQAKMSGTIVRRAGVRVDANGASRVCDIVVIPIGARIAARNLLFAVMFEEPRVPAVEARALPEAAPAPSDERVDKLEADLGATRAYLQSIIDEHQRTNDDLVSANEELLSSNEELQSLNEELETAKEELQSTNEELSTLNEELQTRNAEVHEVNSDLINILGSVEVPIVIVDGGRRIRRFTPKARPILNLLPTDVGRPIDDIKPTLEIHDLDQKIADVVDTGSANEEEVQGANGRWFRLQIRPYVTLEKRIEGAVISVVDIDVLKRALGAAEWARDYAKATVEAVQTPLIVLDAGYRITSANRAFRDHLNPGGEDIAGSSLFALHGGVFGTAELRSALASVFARREHFEKLELALDLPRLGIRTLSFSGRAVAMPTVEQLVLLAVEDITDRRRDEAERRRLLAEAETAKASAEAANRAKDEFLAMLSHELRTPLSTLLMHGELLVHTPMDAPATQRAGEAISRAARAQAQLIDDLLDVSRIVAGKLRMDMQPTSLTSTAREAIEVVRAAAERKDITLESHLDDTIPTCAGDPARLQQVLWNLLTNAIKFTPEHGRVVVTVDADGDRGRIRVQDNGVGIEPSFLPHVFQRFRQEDRVLTRTVGGLGLGLGLVRYVVEAHGGTVEVESPGKGKGATFTVLIPLVKAQPARVARGWGAPARGAAEALEGVRILVVEDDPGTRETLVTMLRMTGAEVRAVASASTAMTCLGELRPELLVCDIAMPEEDGYSLIARIRALGPAGGGDVPALALTALAGDEDRRRAAEAGFQMHMAKPVDIGRLVTALAQLRAESLQRPTPGP